ncbi:hypothetical protein PGT21_005811 [Puccinia graminis f. sp. tritici]|uniref:Hydrophobin n=1 Tax=Puccinia graminis f. sp. tritici TaxID=56615 RepID=A0A5B0QA60_PUCGR|nr:hypothetical protein PGTUg99_015868 [Puccinia graminis f. sp. tritici]KAA1109989.1 hypothetical protein PGT21_005811 [Puccinia graminis f. sp. tritici]
MHCFHLLTLAFLAIVGSPSGAKNFECNVVAGLYPTPMCFSTVIQPGQGYKCYLHELETVTATEHFTCSDADVPHCCHVKGTGMPTNNNCIDYSKWMGGNCEDA